MSANNRFFTIIFFISLFISGILNAQNLITNPGFENGITGWGRNMNNGAIVSFTTDTTNSPEGEQYLKCVVSKLGANDWDVQLRSNTFAVNQSHKYRLTFKAKSETSGAELKVYIQKNSWMGKSFTLTNSWKTYTYEFFPNENTKELKFNFVKITSYFVDDILIEDITPVNSDYNTPPSCVITAPHVNAYYKTESSVTINAYATDIGGSGLPGEISKVEFFVDENKIGETSESSNNTYSINWDAQEVGEYRITATATDLSGKKFTSAGVLISVGTNEVKEIGLSAGKGKYLGNVCRNEGIQASFLNYWNSSTSGNGGKWQTVERTRDRMNWTLGDQAYNLAKNNHLPYRYHTIAWGSQYPYWIKTLSPADFQEEMEEFISAIAERYLYIDQIDVINEALPGHQEDTKYFINALGGAGESGYDWAVWLFKKSREYFPNAKLILNDFAMVNSSSNIREQLLLLQVLRDSALVDGFGAQAHTFNLDNMTAGDLQKNLDLMATAGIPLYITEMDMEGKNTDEASQLTSYKNLFPVLWEHPAVAGITLWGYVFDQMWKPKAGLVYADGTERPGMIWLKDYLEQQEDVGYPLKSQTTTSSEFITKEFSNIKVYPNPAHRNVTVRNSSDKAERIRIFNIHGQLVDNFEVSPNSDVNRILESGMYLVKINGLKTIKLLVND